MEIRRTIKKSIIAVNSRYRAVKFHAASDNQKANYDLIWSYLRNAQQIQHGSNQTNIR